MPAPDGPDLVRRLATAAASRDQVLTDGRHSVSYREAARLLEALDARCAGAGGGGGSGAGCGGGGGAGGGGASGRQPLAVECSQSVAGALALLWVLSRGHDAVLLPELGTAAKEAGTPRFIPGFCAIVVTAAAGPASPAGPEETAGSPEDGIQIAANPGFVAEPAIAAFQGPDLYLRTSGSTGIPKLTRMSHRKWLDNAMGCVDRWRLTAADRLSVPVPIFHSYGFGAAFLPGLLAGAAMDVGSGGNVLRYLEREKAFAPTVGFLTPALCDMLLSVRRSAAARPYRLVVTAGDKVKRETMAAFEPRFGPLLNLYGSAEMGAVSAASPEDAAAVRLATAGYPLAGIELRVEETGEDLGAGEGERAGRLYCRQQSGSDGYLILDPGGTRYQPRADHEWFETGDLARLRADGYVEILGRTGLSVKRDGLLVVFADVEAAVEKVAGVRRAIVVAAGESSRGSRLVAVCLMDGSGGELRPEAVRRRCGELLPRYAVPDEVTIVEALPHLPSGKVDRRAVRDLVAAQVARPAPG